MPTNEHISGEPEPAETTTPATDVAALDQAVDDGALWIDGLLVADGTPERCAARYEQLADQVDEQLRLLGAAVELPGFGGFDSGIALRKGFEGKADDAITRLREYSATARQLAQTFRAAARAYQQSDHALAVAVAGASDVETTGAPHA
ncbi:hypothetical protein [Nocardia callitridis]|uniref:ESX-1 secretion-associated protein n=1 Tax=Nocardia callitridis TaxID=648753 RepID=A0ABP9JR09_9NOCA